jgi:hypothetical protein
MKNTHVTLLFIGLFGWTGRVIAQPITDTVFADHPLPGNGNIRSGETRFVMLINSGNNYNSIKFLDRKTQRTADKLTVVEKLFNGTNVNIDSVLLDARTLKPLESYSDINTSRDSFAYTNNTISGTMLLREGPQKGTTQTVDTTFPHPLFNGLLYPETLQALTYRKGHPFILAEYVPGHNTKYSRIEYLKDEDLEMSGTVFKTKVLEAKIGSLTIHYWLNAADQQLLKIEGKFPAFDYRMLRVI